MHKGQKGFTLLELLLVFALLATVTSVVVISMPNSPQESLKRAMISLSLGINNLSDKALIRGHTYAMRFQSTGYIVLQLDDEQQWQSLSTTSFTNGVIVKLVSVEDEAVKVQDKMPSIFFWADGTVTPFELRLRASDLQYRFRVDALGTSSYTLIEPLP